MNSCGRDGGSAAGHVALFMPSLGGGGAERAMLNIGTGLLEAGFRVDLLLSSAVGPYRSQVPEQIRVVDFGVGRMRDSFPGMVRYLRSNRPQVMLSTPFRANILSILARKLTGSPVRVFVREAATMSESLRSRSGWQRWQALRLARALYPLADGVVAVSAGVAEDLQTLLRLEAGKLRVINNPVINRDLLHMATEKIDHPWFLDGSPPVILGVGRLAPQKDFSSLLRAFARVQGVADCRLVILGEGPDRGMLEQLARELGVADKTAMPGFVANPFPYMRTARLLVLSSRHEGLPNVLIQAMALGTQVIATDCPSGPAEILDHGRYGPLVAIGDVDALAEAILSMLAGAPDALARERLRGRSGIYHVEKILPEYLDMFFPGGKQPALRSHRLPAGLSLRPDGDCS